MVEPQDLDIRWFWIKFHDLLLKSALERDIWVATAGTDQVLRQRVDSALSSPGYEQRLAEGTRLYKEATASAQSKDLNATAGFLGELAAVLSLSEFRNLVEKESILISGPLEIP